MPRFVVGAVVVVMLWVAASAGAQGDQASSGNQGTVQYLAFETPCSEVSGTMLVPLRPVVNWLGVTPEKAGRNMTLRRGEATLTFQVGKKEATLNGKAFALPVAAAERDGVTLIPLKSACQALGVAVTQNKQEHMIVLQAGGQVAKIATATEPVGQPDILWVSSSPLGARVYIGGSSDQYPSSVGITPLAVPLPPGQYAVIVALPNAMRPDAAKPIVIRAKDNAAAMKELAKRGDALAGSYTAEGSKGTHVLEMRVRLTRQRRGAPALREGWVDWGYVWTVTKQEGKQANLVAVFQKARRK